MGCDRQRGIQKLDHETYFHHMNVQNICKKMDPNDDNYVQKSNLNMNLTNCKSCNDLCASSPEICTHH